MKKLHFILLAVFCLTLTACENKEKPEKISLANTQWQLVGFVNKQTGVLRAPEPLENCDECFTINFTEDRFTGFTTTNGFFGAYEADYAAQRIQLLYGKITEAGEKSFDGSLFAWSIIKVHSFNLQKNELRLYSTIPEDFRVHRDIIDHVNNNYLLLKRIEL